MHIIVVNIGGAGAVEIVLMSSGSATGEVVLLCGWWCNTIVIGGRVVGMVVG